MIAESLRAQLLPHTGRIREVSSVGGGCISNATRLEAERGTWFLKHAEGQAGATFEAEAVGLQALAQAATGTGVHVPRVIAARDAAGAPGFLLMEWIEQGSAGPGYWEGFGRALARLHRKAAPVSGQGGPFGFSGDNFIGRLPQKNDWRGDWPAFFRELRLGPQFARARSSGHWRPGWEAGARRLLERLDDLFPSSPHPSMLHGDLWSGNQLPDAQGRPCLVDPAAYAGDREADLAMTELFGGFDGRFYSAYREEWPLSPGYEERREVYNLYHLVNHLNHFGASYAAGVERVLTRFGS